MSGDALLAIAAGASVGGIAALRLAWSRRNRSLGLNALGWGLLLAGAVSGWRAAGAWGTSVAALWAMGAAFAVLAWAAATARAGRGAASNRRVGMLPEGGEPLRLGGRILTFVLVAIVAGLLAVGAGLAMAKLTQAVGGSAANASAAALFVVPLAWGLIAYAVLMEPRRTGQFKALALASIPTWPVLAAGVLA